MLKIGDTTILVEHEDITDVKSDVLFFKYADAFYGADALMARILKSPVHLKPGEVWAVLPPETENKIKSEVVIFFGVGELMDFRYDKIRQFGERCLNYTAKHRSQLLLRSSRLRVATTIHGPGFGLDERESFYSLLSGFQDALSDGSTSSQISEIKIVENDWRVVERLKSLLVQFPKANSPTLARPIEEFGKASEVKPAIFTAMPFHEKFDDEWHAILEAGESAGFKMERLDLEPFVGDVLTEIKKRIEGSRAIIAVLNERNANVFLELGYAWAKGKPAILILKDGETAPFDVQSQRQIRYKSSFKLRDDLQLEMKKLRESGAL